MIARCLVFAEIKNIDSRLHAGLHRGSIRFSPARQYPFFLRTVRGTNCSCPPPHSPLSSYPLPVELVGHEPQETQIQKSLFFSIFFLHSTLSFPQSRSSVSHPNAVVYYFTCGYFAPTLTNKCRNCIRQGIQFTFNHRF